MLTGVGCCQVRTRKMIPGSDAGSARNPQPDSEPVQMGPGEDAAKNSGTEEPRQAGAGNLPLALEASAAPNSSPAPPAPPFEGALEPPTIGDPGAQPEIHSTLASSPAGRADTILDFGGAGDLEIRAASLRGRAHRYGHGKRLSKTRQDDYCFQLSTDGRWLVVFVADGVGQAPESHVAATIATRRGCQLVVQAIDDGTHPSELRWDEDIAPRVAGFIVSEATRRFAMTEPHASEPTAAEVASMMSTTAAAAVISTAPDSETGMSFFAAAIAGDCSIWTLGLDEGWHSLTPLKNEGREIASNAVRGLPYLGDVLTFAGALRPGTALFLMSDGLGDPLGSGEGEVGRYLAPRWAAPPGPYEFARTLDFFRRAFDDDRTAVGIWASENGPK